MSKKKLLLVAVLIISFILTSLSIKGLKGDPLYYQTHYDTSAGGPYESSGTTSRLALTKSIVDNHSLSFNKEMTKFAYPDVVKYNGNFFTIFAPGISFLAVPFFALGEHFNVSQFSTFLMNMLFAVFDVFLIYRLSKKAQINTYAGMLGGLIFIFGTNALSYSHSLTQHMVSTCLMLLAVLNSLEDRTLLNNLLFGLLFSFGLMVDIPNAFMMLPPLALILFKHLEKEELKTKVKLTLNLSFVWLAVGLVPLLMLYGIYNHQLTGSYTKIGQFIGRTASDPNDTQKILQSNTANSTNSTDLTLVSTPFNPRLELNGFYILLISNERGIFYYSPMLLLGILGFVLLYRERQKRALVLVMVGVAAFTVLIYSMFGDPWGGWSYGARYMIPVEAVLSFGVGAAISKLGRKIYFLIPLAILTFYSVVIAVLGAVTTTSVPSKSEAMALISYVPYTYQRGFDILSQNISSSLIYNLYFSSKFSAQAFMVVYCAVVIIFMAGVYLVFFREETAEMIYSKAPKIRKSSVAYAAKVNPKKEGRKRRR